PMMVVDGWVLYESEFYGYQLRYPEEATVRRSGVSGFFPEEKPAGVSDEAYLAQIKEAYPAVDICLNVSLKEGFVAIMAPPEKGGKYGGICPGLGIGAYDVVGQS